MARRAAAAQGQARPFFCIGFGENDDLQATGCRPWVYYAATLLPMVDRDDPEHRSAALDFRLDTGAFASAIPEGWVERFGLAPFLGELSDPVRVGGIEGGTVSGPVARAVPVRFLTDPDRTYRFDFLVLRSLNRRARQTKDPHGLIALRDLVNNFSGFALDGTFVLGPDGRPISRPDLVLSPR